MLFVRVDRFFFGPFWFPLVHFLCTWKLLVLFFYILFLSIKKKKKKSIMGKEGFPILGCFIV